ncbi:MAG: type I-E CRISPR-associated protein Cse2/CasB [Actinomycetales bacterium]|nr:type I-E CRISPR-associated protein Cse2/CasB [Actinomycetales bacterium]
MSLPDELASFTGRLLAVRGIDKSLTADVSRAITAETERYAFAYTVPATQGLHRAATIAGATRALGMVAKYRRSPNSKDSLGSNFSRIPGAKEGLAERLSLVVDLDVEQAAQVLEGLVSRANDARIPINFFELVNVLTFWDTGDPDRDLAHRSRLLFDFYTRPSTSIKKEA